jgi:Flp pilus assembly protein CpaB
MNSRSIVTVAAFLLAVIATVAVLLYVNGVRDEAEGGGTQVEVVVSTIDLPAGADMDDAIADGSFTTATIAEDDVVAGVVSSLDELGGRVTRYPILAGEQITTARLQGSADELPGGVLGIPKGYEAISFLLDVPRVIGGIPQPGDHITAFATFTQSVQATNVEVPVTVNLVPDAQVLKVENPTSDSAAVEGAGQTLITLALKTKDAQRMVFSQELGTLWFALIGPGEEGVKTSPVRLLQVVR